MASREPFVSAVVLAAGTSQRFGNTNKLLVPVDGEALVRRVVRKLLASQIREVVVVTGYQAEAVTVALEGLDVVLIHNTAYAEGMGTSIATGVSQCSDSSDGFLIVLGDMPRLRSATIDRLIARLAGHETVVVPQANGRRGNPVLFGKHYRHALRSLRGDSGARRIYEQAGADRVTLDVDDEELWDFDLPTDLP